MAELSQVNNKLSKVTETIEKETAEFGAKTLSGLAPSSAQYDGNYSGDVSFNKTPLGYEVIYEGEQVAYIEFGTGLMGQGLYPESDITNKANWSYDRGGHGNNGWAYTDHRTGEPCYSYGMIGEKPVYRALAQTRQELPIIVKRVLDEEFN